MGSIAEIVLRSVTSVSNARQHIHYALLHARGKAFLCVPSEEQLATHMDY